MPIKKIIEGKLPVKIWTDEIEATALQQLHNIAQLPIIHHHVAAMPDVHWGIGATVGSVIPCVKAIIPSAVGVDIGCFVGSTKIPLLNGTQKPLKILYEETKGRDFFWVYSIDKTSLSIVPGYARCIKTRKKAKLVKVIISGGEEIICTPDHLFMLRDGTYKEAKDLKFNESLMPLYRCWQARDGYESVSNGKGTSKPTHKLVYKYFNGKIKSGEVIHHKDHNHFNNNPDNLISLSSSEHSIYHRGIKEKNTHWQSAEFEKARVKAIREKAKTPEGYAYMAERGIKNITDYMKNHPEHFKKSVAGNGKRGASYLVKYNKSEQGRLKFKEVSKRIHRCGECGKEMVGGFGIHYHRKQVHGYNHKVISVEALACTEDVYCLQVNEHNNFALSAGVFVHNCGLIASRLNLTANDLPDNLHTLRNTIEAAIPHGRTDRGGKNDRGAWRHVPANVADRWQQMGLHKIKALIERHPKLIKGDVNTINHLGTLGTGNHFIEICLDENQTVWIMLHSGSRGIGNRIGNYFIELAKADMQQALGNLPDKDLAYFKEGTQYFEDYVTAVHWAQDFAQINRLLMLENTLQAVRKVLQRNDIVAQEQAINCHHNYVALEEHYGANVWVTRKGAIRARKNDLGIIPGSMGVQSYIVRGKGNAESFTSCAHGAGRKMSRNEAKKRFNTLDLTEQTRGVECRKDKDVIDEIPAAYKDIDMVMANQADLVDIVHVLKQVVCVKG